MHNNQINNSISLAYLVYSIGFGLSLFFIIFYCGINQWPIWQTVILGSFVQFFYVMSKKLWRCEFDQPKMKRNIREAASKRFATTVVVGYTGAFLACGVWYGLGRVAI